MRLLLLLFVLAEAAYAGYGPVPGQTYLLKDTGTGKYLVLMGEQEDIRHKRGADHSYKNPVRNFTVVSGIDCKH